ncbi:MAG: DNA repair protein RecN [Proteobacteria bacterium]|nr:DNA repair protein RecN [Pseudomonadota bacterium]
MLASLSIRDIVLIEKLDMTLADGLCVLTGETGAGKSILLDALGLAIGARADQSLVRKGAGKASVTAEFILADDHPARDLMAEHDIEEEEGRLLLRRVLSADGKSRAYVNDQPVSVGLLRAIGGSLVEVHGQQDDRGLLNPTSHRALLDAYGGYGAALGSVQEGHGTLAQARAALARARAALAEAEQEEEYDRHALEELVSLDPQTGEEEELASARTLMMQGEKASDLLEDVLTALGREGGIDATIRGALRKLERTEAAVRERLGPAVEALDRAAIEAEDGMAALQAVAREIEYDQERLEKTEERLFALRALARKHKCTADALVPLRMALEERLSDLEKGGEAVAALQSEADKQQARFAEAVGKLTVARGKAAKRLDKAVAGELGPLKMAKARFRTCLLPLQEDDWTADGGERVAFEVATNVGTDFGPLAKIASGGEMVRFVLALKVVLAGAGSAPCLVFDEVDRGVGGAVADAVGARLERLADDAQVLVVTHSPQVAAKGAHHWRISKVESGRGNSAVTVTEIVILAADDRREEIARMLSGQSVTDEARAAAQSLMRHSA